jgi:hypothetical protein
MTLKPWLIIFASFGLVTATHASTQTVYVRVVQQAPAITTRLSPNNPPLAAAADSLKVPVSTQDDLCHFLRRSLRCTKEFDRPVDNIFRSTL